MAASDQLDRIGNDLATHQGGFHSFCAHSHPIADGDGIELHRRSTGRAYAFFHFGSQEAQVVIAGHGLGPSIGDANDRARQVIIGEADGLEHSACACAVTAICDHAAVLFGIRYHGALQR